MAFLSMGLEALFLAWADTLQFLWRNAPEAGKALVATLEARCGLPGTALLMAVVAAGLLFCGGRILQLSRRLPAEHRPLVRGLLGLSIIVPGIAVDPFGWEELFFFNPIVFQGILHSLAVLALALEVFHWASTAENRWSKGVADWFGRMSFTRLSVIFGTVFLAQVFALSFGVLGGIPHVQDELLQDWQARVLASGNLFLPGLALPEFLKVGFTGIRDGQIISHYPPGWPLLLSIGHRLGVPWAVSPLLGLVFLLGMAVLARNVLGEGPGKFTLWLGAFSPLLIVNAAGFMSHLPVALAWILLVGCLAGMPRWQILGGFLGGAITGFSLVIRPLDSVCLHVFATGALLHPFLRSRVRLEGLLAFVAGHAALMGGFFLYNQTVTGLWCLDSFHFVWDDQKKLGFGTIHPFFSLVHDWKFALTHGWENLAGFEWFAFGGGLSALGMVWMAGKAPRGPDEGESRFPLEAAGWFMGALGLSAYLLYFFHDFCLGPRYVFCLLPSFLWLAARYLDRIQAVAGHAGPLWTLLSAKTLLSIGYTLPALAFGVLNPFYWNTGPVPLKARPDAPRPPAIVLIRGQFSARERCEAKMAGLGAGPQFLARMHLWTRAHWNALERELDRHAHRGTLSAEGAERLIVSLTEHRSARPETDPVTVSNSYEIFLNTEPMAPSGIFWCFHDLGEAWRERLRRAYPEIPLWEAIYRDRDRVEFRRLQR